MTRPVLVIDIGGESVSAGLVSNGTVDNLVSHGINGEVREALKSVLEDMEKMGYREFSRVVVGLPGDSMSMRIIRLPFADRKKLEEVLPFELETTLLKGTGQTMTGTVQLADERTLAVVIEKDVLRGYIETLEELGLEPNWVGSSIFSRERLLKKIYDGEETAALVDDGAVVVRKDGKPLFFKGIRDEAELKLALASLEAEGVEIKRFYCTEGAAKRLEGLGKDPTPAGAGLKNGYTGVEALALHLADGLKDTVNFRTGEFADTTEMEAAKKGAKVALVMLAVLAVLWALNLVVQFSTLNSSTSLVEERLSGAYSTLFPEEKNIVDAAYQLEVKLKELREKNIIFEGNIAVLEGMMALAGAAGPETRVRLYRVQMHGEKITAKGETESFETASRFKDALSRLPYFEEIKLTDVKTKAGGRVSFSVALVTAGGATRQ